MSDPNPAYTKNWILTDHGDLINLDFVSKILWGGNFTVGTPQPTKVYIIHGVSKSTGSTIIYTYADSDTAEAAFNALVLAVKNLGKVTDLKAIVPTIASLSVATGSHLGGTATTITGTNFVAGGVVTVGGANATIVNTSTTTIDIVTPAGTAGAQNVVYTRPDGQTVTAAGAFTYT